MRSLSRVIKNQEGSTKAELQSIFSSACINCPHLEGCPNNGKNFTADNSKNLKLREGDIVKIDLAPAVKFFAGVCALFIPVILAAFTWYFSPLVLKIIKLPFSENLRFILCLAALAVSEGFIFILSRADFIPSVPVIVQKL